MCGLSACRILRRSQARRCGSTRIPRQLCCECKIQGITGSSVKRSDLREIEWTSNLYHPATYSMVEIQADHVCRIQHLAWNESDAIDSVTPPEKQLPQLSSHDLSVD